MLDGTTTRQRLAVRRAAPFGSCRSRRRYKRVLAGGFDGPRSGGKCCAVAREVEGYRIAQAGAGGERWRGAAVVNSAAVKTTEGVGYRPKCADIFVVVTLEARRAHICGAFVQRRESDALINRAVGERTCCGAVRDRRTSESAQFGTPLGAVGGAGDWAGRRGPLRLRSPACEPDSTGAFDQSIGEIGAVRGR